jgi:glycine/D-amino acid oxidase-like deaminating enzyme
MNSSMIVTAPLSDEQWAAIGWDRGQTLTDMAHVYVYAQRTADGRIALGGRGVPYHFGSRFDAGGATPPVTVDELTTALHRLFPVTAGVPVEQAWSGVLGVARDWCATIRYDASAGLAWAGGYAGDGVTTSHVAGRTLADLILGRSTALTDLPWVGRTPRRWEPEPLRFLGVRGVYAAYRAADRAELAHPDRATTPWTARLADLVSGR